MKKVILTLLNSFFWTTLAFSAIRAGTVWEVRTTGASDNGGGFDSSLSGTDFSQQDAGQWTATDLVVSATTTIITSASHNFEVADKGNILNITSGTGWTTGRYQITGVTGTTGWVDRAPGVAGISGGTGTLGGALNSTTIVAPIISAGNTIYIQSGTYNETLDTAVGGGATTAIKWKGYITNHSTIPYGDDRPLFDAQSTRASGIIVDQAVNEFYHLRVANGTGDGITLNSGTSADIFYNVKSSSNTGDGFGGTVGGTFFDCESASNGAKGFDTGAFTIYYCYAHDNTSNGIGVNAALTAIKNISESNTGSGFGTSTNNNMYCYGNVAYNNTGASTDGFQSAGSGVARILFFLNNAAMNNGRFGFNGSSTQFYNLYFDYNAYYGNGTAGLNNYPAGANDVTTDPLFTAPDADPPDFTLQSSSPLLSAGYPDANWATNVGLASGTFKVNIGVDQDDNAAGGGGTTAYGFAE